jgi:hypothetical protein
MTGRCERAGSRRMARPQGGRSVRPIFQTILIGYDRREVLQGVPAEEVAGRAYGVIDLLFVGSRGYGPLHRALMGDVAGAVVREAGCPVVVTPPRTAIAPRHAANAPATVSA